MEDAPSNEESDTDVTSEPPRGKPKPPWRPRIRWRGIRLDRVWRARFLLICGTLAGIAVLAMLARPTGNPHLEPREALVPGGESERTPTISGRGLYKIAGCEADAVNYDDGGGRQLSGSGGSAASQAPDRTAPPGAPTLVAVGLYIVEVTEVNEVDNTFTIEGFMDQVWCDPTRVSAPEPLIDDVAAARLERGWDPNITFVDEIGAPITENQELILRPSGTVDHRQKFNVTLEESYDLRRFPFDRQTLRIELESFDWTATYLELRSRRDMVAFSERFEIPEWRAVAVDVYTKQQKEARDREKFSELVVTLDVDRESGFYVWKILVPLVLLVAISWSVFWMSGESLAARIGISFTGILTVVAYQFVIDRVLPKVSYFTLWDTIVLLSFVLMGLTVAINVLQAVLRIRRRDELANEIDATARVAFPVTYVAGLAVFLFAYLA